MLHLFQSNDAGRLFEHLKKAYMAQDALTPFYVVVSSAVAREHLLRALAQSLGVGMLLDAKFFSEMERDLMASVLRLDPNGPQVSAKAPLGQETMAWRLFGYLSKESGVNDAPTHLPFRPKIDETHPLHALVLPLADLRPERFLNRLWQVSLSLAQVLGYYNVHRTTWLLDWAKDIPLDINAMAKQREKLVARFGGRAFLEEEIEDFWVLEKTQRHLWRTLFAADHLQKQATYQAFFAALAQGAYHALPKHLYIYAPDSMPADQLNFLGRLANYIDIHILHSNPSQEFWADIVDERWLMQQTILNPQVVVGREVGHPLLSRLGKSSRELFALLVGVDAIHWQDDFIDRPTDTRLHALQSDILQLDNISFDAPYSDDSILVHACPTLVRELEIFRIHLARWLNAAPDRNLWDVLVLMPDIRVHAPIIQSMFSRQEGTDGLILPAKITGVVDDTTERLWGAMRGFCTLPNTLLMRDALFDHLLLPHMHEALGLDFLGAKRMLELLTTAGFVRGLHAEHLQESLNPNDKDTRFTFKYALDRLFLALLQGTDDPYVSTNDIPYLLALKRVYEMLCLTYVWKKQKHPLPKWLMLLDHALINPMFGVFGDDLSYLAIVSSLNSLQKSALHQAQDGAFDLGFVLSMLGQKIAQLRIAAEPSSVITFARFGAIRKVDYKLVVMMHVGMDNYPKLTQKSLFDLTRADIHRLGDTDAQDNDGAVFLDAIVHAKEALWVYYEAGAGEGERLPSPYVSELLDFFARHNQPNIVHHHTFWPFEASQDTPMPPLWSQVKAVLDAPLRQLKRVQLAPTKQDVYYPSVRYVHDLARDLTYPIVTYANARKLPLGQKETPDDPFEALFVSPLGRYKLLDAQINAKSFEAHLPAGVGAGAGEALNDATRELLARFFAQCKCQGADIEQTFDHNGQYLGVYMPHSLEIEGIRVLANVPQDPNWLIILPHKATFLHLLRLYLANLIWCALDRSGLVGGCFLVQGGIVSTPFVFCPHYTKDCARGHLSALITHWKHIHQVPDLTCPRYVYLHQNKQPNASEKAVHKRYGCNYHNYVWASLGQYPYQDLWDAADESADIYRTFLADMGIGDQA